MNIQPAHYLADCLRYCCAPMADSRQPARREARVDKLRSHTPAQKRDEMVRPRCPKIGGGVLDTFEQIPRISILTQAYSNLANCPRLGFDVLARRFVTGKLGRCGPMFKTQLSIMYPWKLDGSTARRSWLS
jgi:hypothetical protein